MTITANLRRGVLDYDEVVHLKQLGLTNLRIAERLGVTQSAIYYVLNRTKMLDSQRRRVTSKCGSSYYVVKNPLWIKFLHKYKPDFGSEIIT